MMRLNCTFLVGLGLLGLLLLVSCQREVERETAVINTPTIAPTNTAVATLTSLPPTATQTPVVTLTPLPTFAPDEAVNKVIALLQDNQNPDCLLPCWWGATPGQTTWQDIEPFLKSFALEINDSSAKTAFVAFSVPEDIYYTKYLDIAYGLDMENTITDIWIPSVNIMGYDPQTMMTVYGVPDELWLLTFDDVLQGDVLPLHLVMVYQKQGISFHYYVDASRVGEMVIACFEPGIVETERPKLFPAGPRLTLWEPGQTKTIEEAAYYPDEPYYPLEEKTDLTPQTFYEKFTNPDESPCIETPSELWNE